MARTAYPLMFGDSLLAQAGKSCLNKFVRRMEILILVLLALLVKQPHGEGRGFKAHQSVRARALLQTPEGRDHIRQLSRG